MSANSAYIGREIISFAISSDIEVYAPQRFNRAVTGCENAPGQRSLQ
jgi:hypothetical protein